MSARKHTRRRQPTPPRKRKEGARKTFRQEVVDLHREIFRRNQQRINDSVAGYSPAFKRYEEEYKRGVTSYRKRASFAALDKAIARSDVVYVGDYHTLPQAQRSFLRLLRRLPADQTVILAMEFVQGRHQNVVDAYVRGEVNDAEFLAGIDHENHWMFSGWASFKPIFELARERAYYVLAIDTLAKGPAGTALEARDRYASKRIAKAMARHPEALVMVFIGELHVAPTHLPARVDDLLAVQERKARSLIIYQNCEEIYWALERKGVEHDTELVEVAKDQYCVMNTLPIVSQQSFLNWFEYDDESQALEAPEENFKEFAQLIAAFFDIELGHALDDVEVTTIVDLSFLERLQRRGDFSDHDMELIQKQILQSESYFIPRAKMVYLGNLSVNHAAEEATHFLRHVCADITDPQLLVDAFYARALEEAIAFMGSKLINHKRKCARDDYFEKVLRRRKSTAQEKEIARLVLKHSHMQQGKRVRGMDEIYDVDAEMFNALTHIIGYQLGERMYYGLVDGWWTKEQARHMFFHSFTEEGEALTTYLYLVSMMADVKVPERL